MIVNTNKAPKAIGPYVQAKSCGDLLFISGCCPFSEVDGSIVGENIKEQATKTMSNVKAIVEAAGKSMDDMVKTTCFLSDMNNFAEFNAVYQSFFNEGNYPARSCVEVARLPKDILVEVEAIVSLK